MPVHAMIGSMGITRKRRLPGAVAFAFAVLSALLAQAADVAPGTYSPFSYNSDGGLAPSPRLAIFRSLPARTGGIYTQFLLSSRTSSM